jgi:hypothetical protein
VPVNNGEDALYYSYFRNPVGAIAPLKARPASLVERYLVHRANPDKKANDAVTKKTIPALQ